MRILLLGPGYFEGDSDRNALHERFRLAELLGPHEVGILELIELDEPDLTRKFKAATDQADVILVWLPINGKLSTVFGELLLLRYEEAWHGKRIVVFAETGVLDASGQKFRSIAQSGQMAFLLDLPTVYDLSVFEYDTTAELDRLVSMYADGSLEA